MADTTFNGLLNSTCTIKRPDQTIGARKLQSIAYSTYLSSVLCRVKPSNPTDVKLGVGGNILNAEFKGYFKPGVDIREDDLVVVASGNFTGSYIVVGVDICMEESVEHHRTAYLQKQDLT